MRKDKVRAYELRRKGKSYSAISGSLNIPKSTLAVWFKDQEWSQEIRDRLGREQSLSFPKKLKAIMKANKERWAKKHEEYREAAIQEFKIFKDDPLFLTGIMLYWGEGDKLLKNGLVRLSNSDPAMIRIFNLFLLKSIKISSYKISAALLLYPDLVDSVQKNFWSKATGIPIEQFKKSVYIKGRHPKKRLSYGVCNIYVCSRPLKERILKWLGLYQDYLRSHSLNLEK